MDQLPRLGKRELICLLLFTCNYVVSAWRGFLFLCVLGVGYVILLWHYLSLPYNYQSSATLGTCSLQEVAASWLRFHAANVYGASSANCIPSHQPPSAPFRQREDILIMCEECDAASSRDLDHEGS